MLVMDLDHFKFVNDNYGHDVGDKIIANTANIAKSYIREGDLIARLGGEEFMIILPNTSLKEANNIAERIRKAIEESVLDTNNNEVSITVSIGLTSTKQEKEFMSYELLFKTADEALYEAKNTGRNVVITKLYQKGLC
jgi:diguanylate cyclase (GGDEF)-like protein